MLEKDQRILEVGYSLDIGSGESEIKRCYHYNNNNYNEWRVQQKIENEEYQEYEDMD